MLCQTVYNDVLYIVQCYTTHCTMLYYTVYNTVLQIVQCYIKHCTILCYTVYNTALHSVRCCVTLCKMNYNTLYNVALHIVQSCKTHSVSNKCSVLPSVQIYTLCNSVHTQCVQSCVKCCTFPCYIVYNAELQRSLYSVTQCLILYYT